MKKDAYYFPHDSNAKDDPKCVMLIEQLNPEGYGIFWILIEILREQPNFKYPLALLPSIARRYCTSKEKVEAVIYKFGLFEVENDEFFYSNSLINRMQAADMNRINGIKGALIRYGYSTKIELNKLKDNEIVNIYNNIKNGGPLPTPLNSPLPAPPLALESKGKEIKQNKKKVNKSKKDKYSPEIKNFCASLASFFPEHLVKSLKDSDKWNWVDTIDKLIRLDKFTQKEIRDAVALGTSDKFWKKQFLSLCKLRNKNDDGVKYINTFLQLAETEIKDEKSAINEAIRIYTEKYENK